MYPVRGVKLNLYIVHQNLFLIFPYGRTRLDGYLTKKLGIFALRYVHIVDYSTTFEVF